jgi:hypothetical protein
VVVPIAPSTTSPPAMSAVREEPGTSGTAGRGVRGPMEVSWMPEVASAVESDAASGRETPARVQRVSGYRPIRPGARASRRRAAARERTTVARRAGVADAGRALARCPEEESIICSIGVTPTITLAWSPLP